jgi:hypothetical protein
MSFCGVGQHKEAVPAITLLDFYLRHAEGARPHLIKSALGCCAACSKAFDEDPGAMHEAAIEANGGWAKMTANTGRYYPYKKELTVISHQWCN